MNVDAGLARNTTASAMSSGRPRRLTGMDSMMRGIFGLSAGMMSWNPSVSAIGPGAIAFEVMPLADALQQGGQPAEMSITGGGLDAITSDAYRTSVGKIGIMAVEHQLQLVEAEHGPKPMGYDEFMAKVIGQGKPDGMQLPLLPYYQEWAYDPDTKKLVVVEFPLKKEQRQQETTGASGL